MCAFLTNGHPFTGQCTRHRANPWEHVLNTSSRARVGSSCSATTPSVPVTDMVGTFAELTVFFEGSRFDAGNPGTAKAGIQNVVGLRGSALIDPRGTIWSQKKHKVAKPTHVARGVQCWIFQRVVHKPTTLLVLTSETGRRAILHRADGRVQSNTLAPETCAVFFSFRWIIRVYSYSFALA